MKTRKNSSRFTSTIHEAFFRSTYYVLECNCRRAKKMNDWLLEQNVRLEVEDDCYEVFYYIR